MSAEEREALFGEIPGVYDGGGPHERKMALIEAILPPAGLKITRGVHSKMPEQINCLNLFFIGQSVSNGFKAAFCRLKIPVYGIVLLKTGFHAQLVFA